MSTSPKEKLIIMLDASALKESSCMLRLFNNVVIGYKEKQQNNDVEFGTAFHKFKYEYRKSNYSMLGLAVGKKMAYDYYSNVSMNIKFNKTYYTPEYLMSICDGYANTYNSKNESFRLVTNKTEPLIEIPFCFPYYVDEHMEILMAGTMDEIGLFDNGIYSVEDIKTTSMWNEDQYLEGYKLSPQLYFYRWAIRQYALSYPDSIFATIDKATVGCHISAIFTKGKDKAVTFRRGDIILFKEKELEEFEILLKKKISDLIQTVINSIFNFGPPLREGIINGSCTTLYGPCKYASVCGAVDKETGNMIIEENFIKRHYNPLEFGGAKTNEQSL